MAQLGARLSGGQEVVGSRPTSSMLMISELKQGSMLLLRRDSKLYNISPSSDFKFIDDDQLNVPALVLGYATFLSGWYVVLFNGRICEIHYSEIKRIIS